MHHHRSCGSYRWNWAVCHLTGLVVFWVSSFCFGIFLRIFMAILVSCFFFGLKMISLGILLWVRRGLGLSLRFLVLLFCLIGLCCGVPWDVEILGSFLAFCSFSCDVGGSCLSDCRNIFCFISIFTFFLCFFGGFIDLWWDCFCYCQCEDILVFTKLICFSFCNFLKQ